MGPNQRIYHGWTDSLHVTALDVGGASEEVVSVPTDPVPVQAAERDSALTDLRDDLRSKVESVLPETKPAFTDLVVADDGQLWVQRPAAGPEPETVPWWVLDPERKTIREARLPPEVDLEVVRDGLAYGVTTTDLGAPAVVRYQVEQEA